ncbi:MAG: DUF835 domain-containing protein, partial [Nanoarchaeota archaeon]|nr:DUF835 domain-containing protein [Nanoarchaeota archaeon]
FLMNLLDGAIILLFSAIIALLGTYITFSIFNKVLQENYRRPWLFVGISTIFFALSQFLRFSSAFFDVKLGTEEITLYVEYILEFIAMSILVYGLILELFILKFYKGKFVKMKLIPVQEGTLGGELDLNVSKGSSYIAIKKDRKFLKEEFSMATKRGFEGFLITEENPRDIRLKFGLLKTPIAWINQSDAAEKSSYVKNEMLDESSEEVDPLQLNKIINFIDNFVEQASAPFIMIDLNLILRMNNFTIVQEFLRYISNKSDKSNGILICLINEDLVKDFQLGELKEFLNVLE